MEYPKFQMVTGYKGSREWSTVREHRNCYIAQTSVLRVGMEQWTVCVDMICILHNASAYNPFPANHHDV